MTLVPGVMCSFTASCLYRDFGESHYCSLHGNNVVFGGFVLTR